MRKKTKEEYEIPGASEETQEKATEEWNKTWEQIGSAEHVIGEEEFKEEKDIKEIKKDEKKD